MTDHARSADDLRLTRKNMVADQIARRGVKDRRVLDAMARIRREAFVSESYEAFAYEDTPLPIERGQTISQPFIVSVMAEAAEIQSTDRVLEVGTGSGYAAAVFAQLASKVFSIERYASLARSASIRLAALGYTNVEVRTGDGTLGWPETAPFDAIIVAAVGPRIPNSLKSQLAIGGRLIIPVGHGARQSLRKITRTNVGTFSEENLGPVKFVRLIGAEGWRL